VAAAVPLLVEQEDVARDVDTRVGGEAILEGLDHVDHVLAMEVGLAHGLAVRRGMVDLAPHRGPPGRRHVFISS
jgi:hypothetical protein